nr:putative ribonuclease H-like domain-containing protein [Tanacetum cinerariifolium]
MSANDKFGLGYGDYRYGSILSYENEVLQSVFMNKASDLEDTTVNDKFHDAMHVNLADESASKPSEYASCESDSSVETSTSMPEPVKNASKVVCEPKVWINAPIIEDYESNSDNDLVSNVQEDKEKPSFAFTDSVQHVKTSRENIKETGTTNHSPKIEKQERNGHTRKGLGYAFTRKSCFVCGSFSYLIRDYDFHEKRMAKQAELTKIKNKVTGQRENRQDDLHRALKDRGIVDSGCSRHMTWNKAHLADYQEFKGGFVAFGGSNGRITEQGSFTDTDCLVLSPNFKLFDENQVLIKIARQHTMYSFNLKNIDPSGDLACLFAKASIDESNNWHRRLGHVNFKNLNKLAKGNLVRGLPSKIFKNDHTCVACQKGKKHKASCKAKTMSSVNQPLQILHMDLFGPTSVRSINHKTYFLVIIDGFSRFSWVYFLKSKDETTPILKDFIRQAGNQFNHKVKTIRSDNGTKFKNKELIKFHELKGIKREYSNARTPQQNKVAERKNKTLIEATRTMLADSFLPITFWAEAVNTACYVLNRVLVTKPQNKTPYELLTGKQPIISYLRPFGCHVTILNTIDQLGKFDGKSDSGFLVGYSLNSKAFRVYNLETKRVEENLHVNFLENKPNVAGKGHAWMFDLDYLTNSMNYEPVLIENQANKFVGPKKANNSTCTQANDYQGTNSEEIDLNEEHFYNQINSASTPLSTAGPSRAFNDGKLSNPDPSKYDFPNDHLMPHLKDIYASPSERIFTDSSYDDEGVVTDFNNLGATVSVSPTPTTRIHTIYPKTQILGDPKLAVQTRSKVNKNFEAHALISQALEDESWVDAMQEELLEFQIQKVWILVDLPFEKKAIGTKWVYRNKKDERGVVVRNKARLVAQGHRQEEGIDYYELYMVYTKLPELGMLVCLISWRQMDIEEEKSWCDEFEELMKNRFQISSMGELTFFLGLQIKKKEDGVFISQDKYVVEILKKFDFLSVKTANTSIETQKPLVKDEEAADVDVNLYRSIIGSLMYLTTSRPTIMFAVYACSRFQVTPKTSHIQAVKKIFRYLKGQPKLGLLYPKVSSFDLKAYSDSDYAGVNLDRKSTTRGCQFLSRRLISWQCKNQTIVATSTTEAEYVAAAHYRGQVLWIQNQLLDYGFNFINTKIYINNESTICIVKNLVFHSKTKHIEIRHHFIRDAYEKKLIQVLKIHTNDNVADLLTKAFDVSSKELASLKQTALGKDISNPLMAGRFPKTTLPTRSSVSYAFTTSPIIRTSCIKQFGTTAKVKNINDEVRIQALIDEKRSSQEYRGWCTFLHVPRFVQLLIDHQLGNMSHHKDIYDSPSLTKKVFTNMKRTGTGFSRVVTVLFDNMLVPAANEVGLIQDDVQSKSIPTKPSTSKPYKKHKPKKQQPQAAKVPSHEPSPKHRLPSPTNDPLSGGKDSMKLNELMDLCTHLSNKVLELESEVIDIKSSYKERIEKLEGKVDKLEEENKILKELYNVYSKVDTATPVVE